MRCRPRAYDANEQRESTSIPRSERLEPGEVRQLRPIHTLRLHARVEPDVCEADTEPCHKTSDGCHIGEPAKDTARSLLCSHEGEDREEGAEDDRDVGETFLRCFHEDLGSITGNGQAI